MIAEVTDNLPIKKYREKILSLFTSSNRILIKSPPGSGKTTGIPPMLFEEGLLNDKKLILTVPRRIAAVNSSLRISTLLDDEIGGKAGYRIKGEYKCSEYTKIEIVTEGLLLKLLRGREVNNLKAVIIDEFHERSLNADLIFTLLIHIQKYLLPDLKIILMSATLPEDTINELEKRFSFCFLDLPGKNYPVELSYQLFCDNMFKNILFLLKREILYFTRGRILIFLDGLHAINKTAELIQHSSFKDRVIVRKLYGRMNINEQKKVLGKTYANKPEIILSTNIAETSLTVPGVKLVIDSGMEKELYFDQKRDLNSLRSVFISKSSAEQRAGRAGRTEEGKCIRLWLESKNTFIIDRKDPEIKRVNINMLVLETLMWEKNIFELEWLTPPDDERVSAAVLQLTFLGLIDEKKAVTFKGKEVLNSAYSLRSGIVLYEAKRQKSLYTGALISSILEERDCIEFRTYDEYQSDLMLRIDAVLGRSSALYSIRKFLTEKIKNDAAILSGNLRKGQINFNLIDRLTMLAYPDRIAVLLKDGSGKYYTSKGQRASLSSKDILNGTEFLVIIEMEKTRNGLFIRLALPINKNDIYEIFNEQIKVTKQLDILNDKFTKKETLKFGSIVLKEHNLKITADEKISLIKDYLMKKSLKILLHDKKSQDMDKRLCFLNSHFPGDIIFDYHDEQNIDFFISAIRAKLTKSSSLEELKKNSFYEFFTGLIPYKTKDLINQHAPEKITLTNGKVLTINYDDPLRPSVKAPVQWFFGVNNIPKIAKGQVTLLIDMLSPARRSIQITACLESFWDNSYHLVRKDMRGRYPKHKWPENPREIS